MAAISDEIQNMQCQSFSHTPVVVVYDRYSQDGLLKNCPLPELWRCFLLKHTTEILLFAIIQRTKVNFYNPF